MGQVIDNGEDPQGAPKMDFFQRQFIVIPSNRIMLQKRIQVHPPTYTCTQAGKDPSLGLEKLLLPHFSKQIFNFAVF